MKEYKGLKVPKHNEPSDIERIRLDQEIECCKIKHTGCCICHCYDCIYDFDNIEQYKEMKGLKDGSTKR